MTTGHVQHTTHHPDVERLVRTLLYEGYVLYPYRASNVKNRLRWTIGGLFPASWAAGNSDASSLQAEFIIRDDEQAAASIDLRFLQVVSRSVGTLSAPLSAEKWNALAERGTEPAFQTVEALQVADVCHQSWQEARERTVQLEIPPGECLAGERSLPFSFPPERSLEPLYDDGRAVGVLLCESRPIAGMLTAVAQRVASTATPLVRLTIRAENVTDVGPLRAGDRDEAVLSAMASALVVLSVRGGEFVSLIDPPQECRAAAEACSNVGVWPVLVGREGDRRTMLAASIILPDYPQIAPQSPADLFDATEIDELLALRIQTLTDEEKRETATLDDRSAALLAGAESLPGERMQRLHGVLRSIGKPTGCDPSVLPREPQHDLRPGRRVRLRPQGRADAFDVLLAGRLATIESIETDFEDVRHVAVTVDDDPGRDFGHAGMPGHRFFFRPEELELLDEPDRFGEGLPTSPNAVRDRETRAHREPV